MAFGFDLVFAGPLPQPGLCAAFNPCTHMYAISQTDILPEVTIAKVLTVTLDTVAFSLNKEFSLQSANKMWDGTTISSEYLVVPGHIYIAGTG